MAATQIFILFFVLVFTKEIAHQFDSQKEENQYWIVQRMQSYPFFQQCGRQTIYGGSGIIDINSQIMKAFEMPPHYRIFVDIQFYKFETKNGDEFVIKLDQNQIYKQQFSGVGEAQITCNSKVLKHQILNIQVQVEHSSSLAVIYMSSSNQNNIFTGSWGIKSFTLSFEPCQNKQFYCDFVLRQYQVWSLQYFDQPLYSYICPPLTTSISVALCRDTCQFTIPLLNQISQSFFKNKIYMISYKLSFRVLMSQFQGIKNIVVNINNQSYSSYTIEETTFRCDFIEIVLIFRRPMENIISIDIKEMNGQQFIIKDLVLLTLQEQYYIFNPGCQNQIDNNCLECENGWGLDITQQFCTPICGDLKVEGFEECDDGNDIQFDGCYNCQFQCNENCQSCLFGICKYCIQGFELDINNNCVSRCGDGILIPYQEKCETTLIKQCYDCKQICKTNCIECNIEQCYQCIDGFININNQCQPQCGDKIVIPEFEECDDGNDEQFDGCYECKYQCNKYCLNCIERKCMDQCNYGEILINNKCESVCGNKIITQFEECDDGNLIEFDGCYQCRYSCPLFCNYCQKGICLECQNDFNLSNNQCVDQDICGNSKIENHEECDDNNYKPNDGCYKCIVEINWKCILLNQTLCEYEQNPQLKLEYINQTFSTQYISLTFTQEVKLMYKESNLEQIMALQITNVPLENYKIIIKPLCNITPNLSMAEYIISIEITQLLSEKPILYLELDQNIANRYDMNLIASNKSILLKEPQFLNQEQKKSAQTLSFINKNIIYCLGGMSIMSVIQGEISLIQIVLNTLQYISYLKFINVQYPENVVIFFEFSDLLSINPLLEYFDLISYLNNLLPQHEHQIQNGKFAYYQQQSDLLNNLTCQFFQGLGLLFIFSLITFLQKTIFTNINIAKYFVCIQILAHKCNQNCMLALARFSANQIQKLFLIKRISIKQILIINSWDLIFKIFLYLNSVTLEGLYNYVLFSFALILCSFYIFIILLLFKQSGKRQILYQMRLELIALFRQIFFLSLLVFVQNNQIYQTISISVLNIFYVLVLNQLLKYYEQPRNLTDFINEINVILFTLTSILYFDDYSKLISYERKIIIGFVQISTFLFTLGLQLLRQVLIEGKKLILYIQQKIKHPKIEIKPNKIFD